jgi:hypothetical protein
MMPRLGRILSGTTSRLTPDAWAMIAVAAAVVVANLPYLLGVFDADPLGPRGSLMSSFAAGPVGGQPTIDPNNGFVSQALGHLAAEDLIHFRLPLWNPFEGTGTPLLGEMQSAALFPPTLLTLLANGQLLEHVLLEIVAGIATYLLLRRLSVGRWAALAGGVAFGLNGSFAWFSHAPVNPLAFLPLLLLGVEHAYGAAARARRGGWWLIALAGALSVYAGFPEVAYIDAVLGVVWFAWRCTCLRGPALRAFAAKAAAGAAVGTLLAAPFLAAAISYVNHGDVSTHATSVYGSAHIPAAGLPQLLMPYIYGPILDYAGPGFQLTSIWVVVGGYLSTSLLALAGLGLLSRGRRTLRIVLGLWLLLVFARMYGQVPLLGHVLGWLPGMSRVAFFRYATATLALPVIILAALGIDDLVSVPGHRRRAVWAAVAMLALIAASALGAHSLASQLGAKYSRRPYFIAAVAWGAAMAIAVPASAFIPSLRRRALLLCTVVGLDALVLFAAPELSAPRRVQLDLAPVAYLQRHLGSGRFFTLGPLQPNYGSYFGLASLNINDLPIPSAVSAYIRTRLDRYVNPTVFTGNLGGDRSPFVPSPQRQLLQNLAGYRAAGVTYVLTPAGQALPQSPATFALVARTPTTWIYHLAGASALFSTTDPRCPVHADGTSAATISCPHSTTLIRRETDMPGWSASIDGAGAPIERRGGTFQAVGIGAGTHRVSFSYAPPWFAGSGVAMLAGLLWLLAGALRARRPRAVGPVAPCARPARRGA